MIYRAIWPITDETTPLAALIAEATADLPRLLTFAHARLTGTGCWSVRPSVAVPGSGRITERVLCYAAPAERVAETEDVAA